MRRGEMLSIVAQKLISRPFSNYSFNRLSSYLCSDSGSNNSVVPQRVELTRSPGLLEGCDYEHWFVVMEAPKGFPLRDDIVNSYVKTLAMALGSEEEARKSIYSVSTKYYYSFGCKVPENLAFRIKSLPNVKWVLPDSYLAQGDNSYGEQSIPVTQYGGSLAGEAIFHAMHLMDLIGREPFLDGKVVAYDDKFHSDWIQVQDGEGSKETHHPKKARRKQKKQ